MSTTTMTDEERKAEKAAKERERRARIKAEKEAAKEKAKASGFREGGTPAEILVVLADAGEPLHVKDITARILKRGKTRLNGQTPQASVAAVLSVSTRKDPDSPFVKVNRGVFGLK